MNNRIQRFNDAVIELDRLGISVKKTSATCRGRPMYKVTKAGQSFPYKLLNATGVKEFARCGGEFDSESLNCPHKIKEDEL